MDAWRLCDALSVVQAALLIVDGDPSEAQSYIEKEPPNRPKGYDAAKTALVNAILRKTLPARIIESGEEDFGAPDWHQTAIAVDDLREWLRWRGFKTGFFFPVPEAGPDYLSRFHTNYSSKLAAAIEAWKAVSADPKLRRGKSVKHALAVWLRQHANEFRLTKDDGSPNEQGIDDVAKIANWDTRGGAPKTSAKE
jgi:hypothetical protein